MLVLTTREMRSPVKIGFEASEEQISIRGIDFPNCVGQGWVLWATRVAAGVNASRLPPAQITAFDLPEGTRAKTDRIAAEMIA